MGNLLRRLALPNQIKDSSLRTMQEKLVKIGARVVSHARYVTFQMAVLLRPHPSSYERQATKKLRETCARAGGYLRNPRLTTFSIFDL
jgi:hypothetical protein